MATSHRDLLEQVRSQIREITPKETAVMPGDDLAIIDIRELDEFEQGAIPGAIHIPRGFLEFRIENHFPERDTPIVLYCASGARTVFAAKALQDLGYTNVASMSSGFTGWKSAGLNWSIPRSFTNEQRRRYSRHFLLPEVGEQGQQRLLETRMLLIGAGGLGSPAGLYLAAAGVGTIGIIDDDLVDDSNLQRQVLHTTDRIGTPKVESAAIAMKAINPDINVKAHQTRLTLDNIREIFSQYDIIVDGSDNFATRYLINDASVLLDKPVIHGSIYRFEGQATDFIPHVGPCYRCLFPDPPPPDLAPNCSEAGVLGVLPGTIGLIQATEAIKVALGIGEPLIGRLLTYDALEMRFRELRFDRDPACPVCADGAVFDMETIDYTDVGCVVPALAGVI